MKSNVCVKSSLPSNDVVKWLFGFNTVLLNISLTDELKNVELSGFSIVVRGLAASVKLSNMIEPLTISELNVPPSVVWIMGVSPLLMYCTLPVWDVKFSNSPTWGWFSYASILWETETDGRFVGLNITSDVFALSLSTVTAVCHLTFIFPLCLSGNWFPFKSTFAIPAIVIVASPFGVLSSPLSW